MFDHLFFVLTTIKSCAAFLKIIPHLKFNHQQHCFIDVLLLFLFGHRSGKIKISLFFSHVSPKQTLAYLWKIVLRQIHSNELIGRSFWNSRKAVQILSLSFVVNVSTSFWREFIPVLSHRTCSFWLRIFPSILVLVRIPPNFSLNWLSNFLLIYCGGFNSSFFECVIESHSQKSKSIRHNVFYDDVDGSRRNTRNHRPVSRRLRYFLSIFSKHVFCATVQ